MAVACFIDVETTGLDPMRDEIVEFACIQFAFDWDRQEIVRELAAYSGLRQPTRPIPKAAIRVHGITDQMVQGHSLDLSRIRSLLKPARFIVAHNATFDYRFVRSLLPEAAEKRWYCSMRHVDWRKYGFRRRGLQALIQQCGIMTGAAHRAEDDARALLRLLTTRAADGRQYFQQILQRARIGEGRGQSTFQGEGQLA